MPWGSPPEQSVVLNDISQVLDYCSVRKGTDLQATAVLHGLITRVNPRGGIIFFRLFDGLKSIQVVAEEGDFDEKEWNSIKEISLYSRLSVEGQISLFGKKGEISILLKKKPDIVHNLQKLEKIAPSFSAERITAQILLSELKKRGTRSLLNEGFLEIEPRLLSTSWRGTLLRPIRVIYPGLGSVEGYLATTPAPQLTKALLVTGRDKVFSVSRCFTTTYRDVGVESLLIMAQMIKVSLDDVIRTTGKTVHSILGSSEVPKEIWDEDWAQIEMQWPPDPTRVDLKTPTIHFFNRVDEKDPTLTGSKLSLFKFIWPPNIMIAEGGLQKLGEEDVSWGFLTIHLERIALMLNPTDIRRLADLGEAQND